MKEKNSYLKQGKWKGDRVYKILSNQIYIGTFEFGKYKRKEQDILYVNDYCEPIIDIETWNQTRRNLEKNKHFNYGEHIHLFSSIVKCPDCGGILSSTITYKHSGKPNQKEYYHLTCKNSSCKSKGLHYNSNKIEKKLSRMLDELVRYIYDTDNEIIVANTNRTKELKDLDKAIDKLKLQEKRLVDLYINSTLDVETINTKNNVIKKEIEKLSKRKEALDPEDEHKEYTIELLKKLNCKEENDEYIFKKDLCFSFKWDSLNRKTKKEIIVRMISSLEITRDDNYNIEIKNIKFTDEFISKNKKEYIEYLYEILNNNELGITYKGLIDKNELDKISKDYHILSLMKVHNNTYTEQELDYYKTLMTHHFFLGSLINCPYAEDGTNITDSLILIPNKVYI